MVEFDVLNSEAKPIIHKDHTDDDQIDLLVEKYTNMLEFILRNERDQAIEMCKELLESTYLKKQLDPASQIDPSDMKLRILISDMQQEKGDIVTAHQTILSCLEYPLMKHEENDMVLKLSKLLYNYGCFEESLQAIDAVLRVNPKNTVGLSIKNGLLKEMGKEYSDVEILERQPSKSTPWNTNVVPSVVQIPRNVTLSSLSLILLKKFLEIYRYCYVTRSSVGEFPSAFVTLEVVDMDIEMLDTQSTADSVEQIEPMADISMNVDEQEITNQTVQTENEELAEKPDEVSEQSNQSKKRKSGEKRQSMRVKRLLTEKDEDDGDRPRELESLKELNDIMPSGFKFHEDKTCFKSKDVDFKKIVKQVSADLVLKSSAFSKRENPKTKVNYQIQFDNWETNTQHPFFDSVQVCQEFLDKFGNETNNIGTLLMQLVIFTIKLTEKHPSWTIRISYILCVLVQLLDGYCGSFKSIFKPNRFENQLEQIDITLFISEMLLDSLIDQAGKDLLEDHDQELFGTINANPILKTSRKALLDQCLLYVSGFLNSQPPQIHHLIRYKWLLAKHEEIFGTPRSTVNSLLDCLDLFTGSDDASTIHLLSCNRDNVIDLQTVTTKIKYQQLRLSIDETEYLSNENAFAQVVERLEPLFLHQQADKVPGQDIVAEMPHQKRLDLLKLLDTSLKALDKETPRFKTLIQALMVEADLIGLGTTELFGNLETYANYMLNMITMIESHINDWREYFFESDQEFKQFCFVAELSLHIAWILAKKSNEVEIASKSGFAKKKTLFESFCARAWKLMYYTLVVLFEEAESSQADNFLSETLIWAHDQLGLVNLCGGDDGAFLKLIVHHISLADPYYHYEIYQSFSCLYGTDIKANNNQELYDHQCNKSKFGTEAALILYKFIKPLLKEKVDTGNYRTIAKDVRDCLDMIIEEFPEPSTENLFVKSNKEALDHLLSSDIDVSVLDPKKSQQLVMYDLSARKCIPAVTKDVHFYQGKMLLNNYYTRQDKTSDYLSAAVVHLKHHLTVNPMDIDAWVSLGNAYSAASQDILGSNVTDYRDRIKIASLQKCAFHSFTRAIKLLPESYELSKDYKILLSGLLWGDFALLMQSIISAPMSCAALKPENTQTRQFWLPKAIEALQLPSAPANTEAYIKQARNYLYASMCFVLKKAIKWDGEQWLYYLRLTHAYRKLNRDPIEIVDLYVKTISMAPKEIGKDQQDHSLGPFYKAVVFILKSKLADKMTDIQVYESLSKILQVHPGVSLTVETNTEVALFSDPVFAQIHLVLESIKKGDKRRWHHKPIYRIAWMYSNLLHNDELAKEEMAGLLNARSKTVMRRIWKNDYELPGRHFIYFHQYLKFLIELSAKTRDVALLWQMCRRLRGEDNIILRFQMWIDARKMLLESLMAFAPTNDEFKQFTGKVAQVDPEIEKQMVKGYTSDPSSAMYCLVVACDMKRNRKTLEPVLENFILDLYAKIYLDCGDFQPLMKPVKESKLSAKVMQRALVITRNVKERNEESTNK